MAQYLIVAHQTAASPELVAKLKQVQSDDREAEFVLLVPATPPTHLLTWEEGDAENLARRRASEALSRLAAAGVRVKDTVVGAADPLRAIKEEHGRHPGAYEATLIGTLPPGLSRWLRRDLPNQVRSQLGVRVIDVISHSAASDRGAPSPPAAPPDGDRRPHSVLDLAALSIWLGSDLYCEDGPVGRVREIIYDYATREPVWVGVAAKPLALRTLLVPAAGLCVEGAHLKSNHSRPAIESQPPAEVGEGFACLTDEERLYDHFGIPFSELRDIRVLRPGQALPGLERNEQAILETASARQG